MAHRVRRRLMAVAVAVTAFAGSFAFLHFSVSASGGSVSGGTATVSASPTSTGSTSGRGDPGPANESPSQESPTGASVSATPTLPPTPTPTLSPSVTLVTPTPTPTLSPSVTLVTPTPAAPAYLGPIIDEADATALLNGLYTDLQAGAWDYVPGYFAPTADARAAADRLFVRFFRDSREANRITDVAVDWTQRCPMGDTLDINGTEHVCGPNAFYVDYTLTRPAKWGGRYQTERRLFELVDTNGEWGIGSTFFVAKLSSFQDSA